ncbi:MAG TPA: molybdenum cofactor biosynthesis protein MoaE [Terriglobales bacterium]|nr:molybdenum cofactor biosynthesis protein MoaE [Terriglobales bacterium]
MQVRVLFFGMLKDVVGRGSDSMALPAGATLADLLARYQEEFPRLEQFLPSLALSVNQEYAAAGQPLRENDEVALLPPVSGGAPAAAEPAVRLVRERIVPHDIIPPLEKPEDGAVVIFDGVARNHTRGRKTLYLDYEAYEPMALGELRRLAAEAREKFPIRNLALVHRLGRIQIGESSVLIAVYSAHRAPAFEACRWLIDTLKKKVPIWKKEYFEDGAVWADGEPFPADIPKATTEGAQGASK